MLATEITNHVQIALSQFLQQYQGRPRLAALMTALVAQIQDLEDAFYALNAGRQLYEGNAVGQQLDGIGELVGLPRNGADDPEYLVLLNGTVAENNSDTTIPTMVNVVDILFSPSLLLSYNLFPAAMGFAVGGATLDPAFFAIAAQIIQNSLGGGITLDFVTQCDATNAFRYCELTGTPAQIAFPVTPTDGDYSLFFGGVETAPLPYNTSAADLQTAINAISGLSEVTVTGSYNTSEGFAIDWGQGAQVPIVATGAAFEIAILNSVIITPGTGGGYGDANNPSIGGLFAGNIYSAA